jgi:hypothetical protein
VSVDFTLKSTTFAPRTPLASSLAFMRTLSSKALVSTRSPPRRTASTCCARAMSVTSWPARASMPP